MPTRDELLGQVKHSYDSPEKRQALLKMLSCAECGDDGEVYRATLIQYEDGGQSLRGWCRGCWDRLVQSDPDADGLQAAHTGAAAYTLGK